MDAARLLLRASVLPPLLALACATPASGEPCIDYGNYLHVAGRLPVPDFAVAIAVEGSLACIATRDSGLLVADVSDPGAPVVVSQHATSGRAFGVALAGDLAYVAAGLGGLEVVDVSDPAAPVTVARLDTPGLAFAVALARGLAFVADRTGGLVIADLSDPRAPVLTGRIDTPGLASGLAIEGTIAYVAADEDGLQVIDFADPSAPILIGSLPLRDATGVALGPGHAYVAADDLVIVDVSDPAMPIEVSRLPMSVANLVVRDDLAFVPEGSCFTRLRVFDLTVPAEPAVVGTVLLSSSAWNLAVTGDRAYLSGDREVTVIDFTEVRSPSPAGTLEVEGSAAGLALAGDLAYVTHVLTGDTTVAGRFDVVDLTVPGSPAVLGSLEGITSWRNPVLAGALAFVPCADGLKVVDVSRHDAPVLAGMAELEGADDVAIIGSRALVVTWNFEVVCVDVADPSSPRITDRVSMTGRTAAVDVLGTLAYIACDTAGVAVLDCAVPGAPVLRSLLRTPGQAWDIDVDGEHAFIACASGGLVVADLSDPVHPSVIAHAITWSAWDVAVAGGCAYVTGEGELQVFDVADPRHPRLVGSAYPGHAASVAAGPAIVAVAAGEHGLLIYPPQCRTAESVEVAGLAAVARGGEVEITWLAGGEEDLAGFDVQRSERVDAGYVTITREPIRPPGPYVFRDVAPLRGVTAYYRLEALSRAGASTFFGPVAFVPGGAPRFVLDAAFPQPSGATDRWATIGFELPERAGATLRIYDPAGRLVRELAAGVLEPGTHVARWDGRDQAGREVASGVYFCRLESAGRTADRSLVLLR